MSELTRCNYCDYEALKREAKKRGERVRTVPDKDSHWPNAVRVEVFRDGKWHDRQVWFAALTDHCVC